ncbi:SURF1 family protein [Oceaniglobus ichthyenteri]|uniref:SURF1 family protein n=1 Tax=Oceaniglobus ichthyenteri TaxID=2136177 RepID=UPI000D36B42B|nr:SURF1 family protein [Oceaniglobus ichthyenteri]
MGRIVLPLGFGLIGFGILLSLGLWQMQRLTWKEGVLAEISARISDAPVDLPVSPTAEVDQYLAVTAAGTVLPDMLRVLVSQKGIGAGYRIVSPFDLGDRVVLLDRGIMPVAGAVPDAPTERVVVTGNLLWPDEIDGFTPDPDLEKNIWFGRDLAAMADHFGTEPVLIVLRESAFDDAPIRPVPVGATGIPNDHLGYAITWFSLALVWAGMTGFFLWRMTRQRTEG